MTLKKVIRTSTIISGVILVLMAILRNAKSEVFTMLSLSLGGTILFVSLYYLYTTELVKNNPTLTKYKYIFFGISIPILIYGIEKTRGIDGFFPEAIKILLAIEIFYLIFSWIFKKWKGYETLKNEKIKAELSLLKEQINPHFFFNTLNNLYSLIKKDSNAAQEYVLKLSDLMRFTIYDSGKESVLLKDEINYLINYIDLQIARYHKDIDVNFIKRVENSETKVAPLLNIILLENAFKHGVEKTTDNASVHLELIEDGKTIEFVVKNNFDVNQSNKNSGIGLKNLKERLNLLYPNNHQLMFHIEEDIYTATLVIHKK